MSKHLLYYLSLIIMLCLGLSISLYMDAQKQLQVALVVFTACIYAFWGIFHHVLHHSFSIKIMLEYISIAVLGMSIVLFVLNVAL